jgi:hypothetical protein
MSGINQSYVSGNFDTLFNNKSFAMALVNAIKDTVMRTNPLKRDLSDNERMFILSYLRNINPARFSNKSTELILHELVQDISSELISYDCRTEKPNDIKLMLFNEMKKENNQFGRNADSEFVEQIVSGFNNQVDVMSVFGLNSFEKFLKAVNPELIKKKCYFTLDSRYRLQTTDGNTTFSWNFINNETVVDGSVNAIGEIRDIVAVRVYPVRIPYTESADNKYKRITMFINEFSAQSFLNHEGNRNQFWFDSNVDDRWIELDPFRFNDGYFYFRTPITRIETMTISFGSPLEKVFFDIDRMTAVVDTYGTITEITTADAHNLETGDLVYISGFNTNNSNSDAGVINEVNISTGQIITQVDANTFTIDVDSTFVHATGPALSTITTINGSATITGVGTNFNVIFSARDYISIDGIIYRIQTVNSPTNLTLTTPFAQVSTTTTNYKKDNRTNGLLLNVFFGSKRIFIPMEIEYFAPKSV